MAIPLILAAKIIGGVAGAAVQLKRTADSRKRQAHRERLRKIAEQLDVAHTSAEQMSRHLLDGLEDLRKPKGLALQIRSDASILQIKRAVVEASPAIRCSEAVR